jgi:hypothetical protein
MLQFTGRLPVPSATQVLRVIGEFAENSRLSILKLIMKAQTLQLLSVAIALSYIPALAQDSNSIQGLNWDANGVDASIHAGLDEHQEAQPPQEVGKRPTTSSSSYSHSLFQFVGEPATTWFWPARANISTSIAIPSDGKSLSTFSNAIFRVGTPSPVPTAWSFRATDTKIPQESEGNSGKLERKPNVLHSLGIGRTGDDSIGPQLYKAKVPTLTPQPETAGFLAPFRKKQFGLTSDSISLPYPVPLIAIPLKQATAKQHKRLVHHNHADSNGSTTITGFSDDDRKLPGSRLKAKGK